MTTTAPLPTLTEEEIAAILADGWSRSWDRKGNRSTTEDAIWSALQDAVEVLDGLPDQERMWVHSGRKSTWRMPSHSTAAEVRETERLRILAGMPLGDVKRAAGRPRDVDFAMASLELVKFVRVARNGDRLAKAAIELLRGDPKGVASMIYRDGKAADRRDNHTIKTKTTRAIIKGIEYQFGEIPDFDRIAFRFAA